MKPWAIEKKPDFPQPHLSDKRSWTGAKSVSTTRRRDLCICKLSRTPERSQVWQFPEASHVEMSTNLLNPCREIHSQIYLSLCEASRGVFPMMLFAKSLYFSHSLVFYRGVFGRSPNHGDKDSRLECLWECFLLGDFLERHHWGIFSLRDCLQCVYDFHKGSKRFCLPMPYLQDWGLLPVSHL
jgi:hypothetical protein